MANNFQNQDSHDDWEDLKTKTKTVIKWIASSLLDNAFLLAWLLLQVWVSRVISATNVSGIDKWLLIIFQIIFGASTLFPVALHIWADISLMYTRYKEMVRYKKEAIKASYKHKIDLLQDQSIKRHQSDAIVGHKSTEETNDAS